MNRLISNLENAGEIKAEYEKLSFKYSNLLKKYNTLNDVFEFHKGIVQNLSSCIITIDLNGNITFLNKSALALIGYQPEEILGKNIEQLFSDNDRYSQIAEDILVHSRMYESTESSLLSKEKKVIPIGFSTTRLLDPDSENVIGVIFIFRNISDLNNLRRQMERMDRLATLGELSAGIAHEIRNPLAGIKTSAQVLEESFSPGDPRSQLVSRIIKEIDRSNKLLQRFFNFAKPSRPRPDFHNIMNIVDGVYLLLKTRFKKKRINFSKDIPENLPKIYIDESQFEQVLLNLFINAIDALPEGGDIKIEAYFDQNKQVHKVQKETGSIIVKVHDNGTGISAELIEKIFNPFYTTKSNGVGLGLSICTRLLDENLSKLEVESKQDIGSTFTIFLPYVQNQSLGEN